MKPQIETFLARIEVERAELDAKTERLSRVQQEISCVASLSPAPTLADLVDAVTTDNVMGAATRLRALGNPPATTPQGSFGKPACEKVIEGDYVEIKPKVTDA